MWRQFQPPFAPQQRPPFDPSTMPTTVPGMNQPPRAGHSFSPYNYPNNTRYASSYAQDQAWTPHLEQAMQRINIQGPSHRPGFQIKRKTAAQIQAEALRNAPKADIDYVRQAHNTPFANPVPQKLLVILDLNGTVLARPSKANKRHFIKRPYVDEFLRACFAKHQVMVWSSARLESVDHMVSGITTFEQRRCLAAEWDRSHLRLSGEAFREKVQVYKQLTWVWDDERIQSTHPSAADGHFWDQTNTVLIDDSYLKASSEPYNHIEIPEFTGDMIEQETAAPVLKELLAYVEEASHFEDVSTFIRSHPFQMPDQVPSVQNDADAIAVAN